VPTCASSEDEDGWVVGQFEYLQRVELCRLTRAVERPLSLPIAGKLPFRSRPNWHSPWTGSRLPDHPSADAKPPPLPVEPARNAWKTA
jgi:hypothetical protein